MRLPYFQVDAFTTRVFGGNPAGVCPLEHWLPDVTLQQIAAENNQSETAFFVEHKGKYQLRWFTPTVEVDLCGHATLASAFVLFSELDYPHSSIEFESKSGRLTASKFGERVELDFPSRPPARCFPPEKLVQALGHEPVEVLKSRDYVALFSSQAQVAALKPDLRLLAQLDCLGLIVTAPGEDADFVSRFFAPAAGIAEDPVTGSAHCSLIPFWAKRLGKAELFARQVSRRGGELYCRMLGDRVGIGGCSIVYSRGKVDVPG